MCFSAEASFAGAIVISAVGVASVKKARLPEQRPFSVIPLIFGLQQFAEGAIWLTLKSGSHAQIQNVATYIFLIAALVVWPVMIPLSMWLMEKVKTRRKILMGLVAIGAILSLFYVYCLLFYDIAPQINGFHIQYVEDFPRTLMGIGFFFYITATITPLFVSSVKRVWLFGILIAISFIVTRIFYAQYVTSVWCFFAALISVAVWWVLDGMQHKPATVSSPPRD